MSFLDEARQDWSKPELPALRDLIVLAYRRIAVVEQLVDEAGIVPGTFPITYDLRSTWTQLIKVMGNQGRLRALVEKVAQDATVSGYGYRFGEMLEEHPAVVMPAIGTEDWWKGGNRLERLHQERLMERRIHLIDIEFHANVIAAARSVV
jgi:hypothetical protein